MKVASVILGGVAVAVSALLLAFSIVNLVKKEV